MTAFRPRRSALYLPASNARALEKARTLASDVVILDLEDAVAPDAKDTARAALVAALREGGFGRREVVVRVNAPGTEWGDADLAALGGLPFDAVLLPKVSDPDIVAACRARLGPDRALWAMIETARAMLDLARIAAAPGLAALVMGTNDLVKELRAKPSPDRRELAGFLGSALAAGRANGLTVLDGVFNAIDDADGFAAECRQGAAFGFDGKTLIHPSQIGVCNAVFGPSEAEIDWAREIVTAFEQPDAQGKGVIRLDGKMVERLHLDQARQTLAIAAAVAQG